MDLCCKSISFSTTAVRILITAGWGAHPVMDCSFSIRLWRHELRSSSRVCHPSICLKRVLIGIIISAIICNCTHHSVSGFARGAFSSKQLMIRWQRFVIHLRTNLRDNHLVVDVVRQADPFQLWGFFGIASMRPIYLTGLGNCPSHLTQRPLELLDQDDVPLATPNIHQVVPSAQALWQHLRHDPSSMTRLQYKSQPSI